MSPLPTTYTTEQVAEAFNVSTDYLRRLVKQRKLVTLRTSSGPRAQLRFTDEHVKQVEKAMTPAAPIEAAPRRRRRRAT